MSADEKDLGASASPTALSSPTEPHGVSAVRASIDLPQRPRSNTPAVREVAIRALAEDCDKWAVEGGDQSDIAGWIAGLSKCFLSRNGYELAKDVERYCRCEPDADLVEILDGAFSYTYDAEEAAVRAWVAENSVTLPLAIGTEVTCRHGAGTITRLMEDVACYIVTPADDPKFANGGGWVMAAEDVFHSAIAATAAA